MSIINQFAQHDCLRSRQIEYRFGREKTAHVYSCWIRNHSASKNESKISVKVDFNGMPKTSE